MIKKGSKVKFIGQWNEPLFLEDIRYFNNLFTVLEKYTNTYGESLLIIESLNNVRRTEKNINLVNTRYWRLEEKDFVEVERYNFDDFNNKLDDILGDI